MKPFLLGLLRRWLDKLTDKHVAPMASEARRGRRPSPHQMRIWAIHNEDRQKLDEFLTGCCEFGRGDYWVKCASLRAALDARFGDERFGAMGSIYHELRRLLFQNGCWEGRSRRIAGVQARTFEGVRLKRGHEG